MNDHDRDLRSLLERAASGVEPSSSGRARALHRARRKRIINAGLAGGAAAVVVVAAVVGGARFLDTTQATQVAGDRARLEGDNVPAVPEGYAKIAGGTSAGVPWLLTTPADGSCPTLMVGRGEFVTTTECPSDPSRFEVVKAHYRERVFVAGSVDADVSEVQDGDGTVLNLHSGPSDLEGGRRFFVTSLPKDEGLVTFVADLVGSPPIVRDVRLDGSVDYTCTVDKGEGNPHQEARLRDALRAAEEQLAATGYEVASDDVPAGAKRLQDEIKDIEQRLRRDASLVATVEECAVGVSPKRVELKGKS